MRQRRTVKPNTGKSPADQTSALPPHDRFAVAVAQPLAVPVAPSPAPAAESQAAQETPSYQFGQIAVLPAKQRAAAGSELMPSAFALPSESGEGLPAEHRAAFEHALGQPLDHVNVHTGAEADQAARGIRAAAFAVGPDLYFADGFYAPGTAQGDVLLGHELTHVVQHDRGQVPNVTSSEDAVSRPDDALEQQAYAQESRVASQAQEFRANRREEQSVPALASSLWHRTEVNTGNVDAMEGGLRPAVAWAQRKEDVSLSAQTQRQSESQFGYRFGELQIDAQMPALKRAPILREGGLGVVPTGPEYPGGYPFPPMDTDLPPIQQPFPNGPVGTGMGAAEEGAIATGVEEGAVATGAGDAAVAAGAEEGATVIAGVVAGESAIPVVGWIALGVTVVGVGAYLGWRYLMSEDGKPTRPLTPEENNQVTTTPPQAPGGGSSTSIGDPATDKTLYTPGSSDNAPRVDPDTGQPISVPGNQSQAPITDPTTTDPAEFPGQPNADLMSVSPEKTGASDRTSAGAMQKQVERGQTPKSVDRVDKGRGPFEKDHVEFTDGSALNYDGTWKHGGRDLTNTEKEWLDNNGWKLP